MAGEEGHMGNPGSAASSAVAAAEAEQLADAVAPTQGDNSAASTADQKRMYRLPTKYAQFLFSYKWDKPTARLGDDNGSYYKQTWNELVDSFNQMQEELLVSQTKLRDEYITKGYVEVDDDCFAKLTRIYKNINDLGAFVEEASKSGSAGKA